VNFGGHSRHTTDTRFFLNIALRHPSGSLILALLLALSAPPAVLAQAPEQVPVEGARVVPVEAVADAEAGTDTVPPVVPEPARHAVLPLPSLFYSADTRWAAGVSLVHAYRADPADRVRRPTTTEFSVLATQNEQLVTSVASELYTPDNLHRISASASYVLFPDAFYGIGADRPGSAREAYVSRSVAVAAGVRRRVAPGWFVGGAYALQRIAVEDADASGLLDTGAVAGSDGGTISSLVAHLTRDTRDHVFGARTGLFADLRVRRSEPLLGSAYAFEGYSLDVRRYHLIGAGHVLAGHGVLTATRGDVPFQAMPRMGGANMMRGYVPNRFRDRTFLAAQAEYRTPFVWRLGAVGFAGAGTVAPGVGDLFAAAPYASYGAGVRFAARRGERLQLRADYAFTGRSRQLYLGVGDAF
jgi:hypothetical protein